MNDNTISNLRAAVNAGFERVGTTLGLAATAIANLIKTEPKPQDTAVTRGELNQNGVEATKTASKHQYKDITYHTDGKTNFVTITKVNRKGQEIIKGYVVESKIGRGGMGTAYKLAEIDKEGNSTQNFKVMKVAHRYEMAQTAMTSGDVAMKGQHVGPKGKPMNIAGIIKPTKYIDETNFVAITTLYKHGDMSNVALKSPKECFDFVGQTLFGLSHMHSKFEPKDNTNTSFKDKIRSMLGLKVKNRNFGGKESVVHRDIKPDNILCTEKNGKKQFVLMDFDGAHVAGKTDTDVVSTLAYRNTIDDLLLESSTGDKGELQKKIDVYALGLSFREVITGADFFNIAEEKFSGYQIKHDKNDMRILMKPTDVPGFTNFSNGDKAKMTSLTNLINQMTDDDYTKRPSPEASLIALKAIGIKVPKHST